ncbi:swarming motility protein YbiA [Candidatus Pacearchaeota archaeon]|nr:swarming motility protein YbiA [Candidatus Pacearchaeota archaeon]
MVQAAAGGAFCFCVRCVFVVNWMEMEMKFRGQYHFLSNMYPCLVEWKGWMYKSSETIYQMEKCHRDEEKKRFVDMNGFQAKRAGRVVVLRPDWHDVKDDVMFEVLTAKFSDPMLKDLLLSTGDIELVEDNHWGDTYWGRCNGQGRNRLGELLMEVREQLR